jgi:scyllo-inositol 2-dehydrogenase (NADP+)
MLDVLVVGLGYKGLAHVHDVESRAGARAAAACDPDPSSRERARAERPCLRLFCDVDEMLDACDGDVLVIAAPPRHHLAAARLGFESGLHVFCEKPFGLDAFEAEEMVGLAAHAGRHLGAGLNVRYLPAVQAARAALEEGALGPVVSVACEWTRSSALPGSVPYPPLWYRSRLETGGGVLRDLGTHVLDAALAVVGYPPGSFDCNSTLSNRFTELSGASTEPPYDVEDTAWVLLRHESGLVVSCYSSWVDAAPGHEPFRLRAVAAGGEVVVAGDEGKANLTVSVLLRRNGGPTAEWTPELPPATTPLRAFLAALEAKPQVDPRELLTLARLLDVAGAPGSSEEALTTRS